MGFLDAVGRASPAIMSNIGQMKQMAIQDEQEKREAVKFQYLQKKMADEEAEESKPIPLALLQTTPLAQHPRAFNLLLENARQNGSIQKTIGGEEFITKKNMKGVLDTMKLGTEAGNAWIGELVNDKKAQVANLYQTMQSGKVKKPEELEQLKKQYSAATEDLIELTRISDPDFIKEYVKTQEQMKRVAYEQQTKPPHVESFIQGDEQVQGQWNPTTRQWEQVGKGPRRIESDTEISLTNKALQGDPQSKAILDSMEERKSRIAAATTEARQGALSKSGFASLPLDEKEIYYQAYSVDKQALPPFAYRDIDGRNAFLSGYSAWEKSQGKTGRDIVAGRAEQKSLTTSLTTQEKARGMMGGFARNIEKQIDRVSEVGNSLVDRVGVRALDMPMRKLKTSVVGSGNERIVEAYLTEISNEIGKLSTGSQASIAELSVGAQEKWAKIHDPNLSFNELKKILEETRDMARMRIESADEELRATKDKMSGGSTGGGQPPKGSGSPGVSRDAAMAELRRRGLVQ